MVTFDDFVSEVVDRWFVKYPKEKRNREEIVGSFLEFLQKTGKLERLQKTYPIHGDKGSLEKLLLTRAMLRGES